MLPTLRTTDLNKVKKMKIAENDFKYFKVRPPYVPDSITSHVMRKPSRQRPNLRRPIKDK